MEFCAQAVLSAVEQVPEESLFLRFGVNAITGSVHEEARNRPNMPLQGKFHRGILRGLINVSHTP